MMSYTVIVHPQIQALQYEIEKLHQEFIEAVLVKDELLYVQNPNIMTEYMLKVGYLEVELFELECEFAMLKRKKALIQRYINHQEEIDWPTIDTILEIEFKEYQQKILLEQQKLEFAQVRNSLPSLSEQKSQELKTLYRQVVKALHPDLNPNVSEQGKKLLIKAIEAYSRGDVQTLEVIEKLVINKEVDDEGLVFKKQRLESTLKNVLNQIKDIQMNHPYLLKYKLEDPIQLEKSKQSLISSIEYYQNSIDQMKKELKEENYERN